jgi:hypothetical protein
MIQWSIDDSELAPARSPFDDGGHSRALIGPNTTAPTVGFFAIPITMAVALGLSDVALTSDRL